MSLTLRLSVLSLVLASSAGCLHDRNDDLDAESLLQRADERLRSHDYQSAKKSYDGVLAVRPGDGRAAFGSAFTDLLLLDETLPVQAFLARCNQNQKIALADQLFGPSGFLSQIAWSTSENVNLTVEYLAQSNAQPIPLLQQPVFQTRYYPPHYPDRLDPELVVEVRDGMDDEAPTLSLRMNPNAIGAGAIWPIPQWSGFSLYDPKSFWYEDAQSVTPPSGTVRFLSGGNEPGEILEIELDITWPGWCQAEGCDSRYAIRGRLEVAIHEDVDFDTSRLPFAEVQNDPGPPERHAFIVALEQCSALDMPFVRDQVEAVGDELASISEKLDMVLADPKFSEDAADLSLSIPNELVHIGSDLPVNATDVRILRAGLDLASAILELAAQYEYAAGPLQDLLRDIWIKSYSQSGSDGPEATPTVPDGGSGSMNTEPPPVGPEEPAQPVYDRQIRDFEPALLVSNLQANLLVKKDAFALDVFQHRLDRALSSLAEAFALIPSAEGMFDFQSPSIRRQAMELSAVLGAIRVSLSSESAVAVPPAPIYAVHLKRFFDAPYDRDRIIDLAEIPALLWLDQGDPQAQTPEEFNDQVVWETNALFEDAGWLSELYVAPQASTQACATAQDCPADYGCGLDGTCEAEVPWFATPEGYNGWVRQDWPVFLNPRLRALFDVSSFDAVVRATEVSGGAPGL